MQDVENTDQAIDQAGVPNGENNTSAVESNLANASDTLCSKELEVTSEQGETNGNLAEVSQSVEERRESEEMDNPAIEAADAAETPAAADISVETIDSEAGIYILYIVIGGGRGVILSIRLKIINQLISYVLLGLRKTMSIR